MCIGCGKGVNFVYRRKNVVNYDGFLVWCWFFVVDVFVSVIWIGCSNIC